MYLSTSQGHGARVRPGQPVAQPKLFDGANGNLISTKKVVVVFLQPGLSILAHFKASRQASGNLFLLKDHHLVTRPRQAVRGHQSQCPPPKTAYSINSSLMCLSIKSSQLYHRTVQVSDPMPKGRSLPLNSTATRHTCASVPLWLYRSRHQGQPTTAPYSSNLVG